MKRYPPCAARSDYDPVRPQLSDAASYLPDRPWLHALASDEFWRWFRTRSRRCADGCWEWTEPEMDIDLGHGRVESAERIAWCLDKGYEPGAWLRLVPRCLTPRCVNPAHQYEAGALADWFLAGRRTPEGCLLWSGATDKDGYGRARVGGQEVRAHVYAFAWEHTWVPDGMMVCHHCDNPGCYEPSHLFLSDQRGNMADMRAKGRSAKGPRNARWRGGGSFARRVLDRTLLRGGRPSVVAKELGVDEEVVLSVLKGEHPAIRGREEAMPRYRVWGLVADAKPAIVPFDDRNVQVVARVWLFGWHRSRGPELLAALVAGFANEDGPAMLRYFAPGVMVAVYGRVCNKDHVADLRDCAVHFHVDGYDDPAGRSR